MNSKLKFCEIVIYGFGVVANDWEYPFEFIMSILGEFVVNDCKYHLEFIYMQILREFSEKFRWFFLRILDYRSK